MIIIVKPLRAPFLLSADGSIDFAYEAVVISDGGKPKIMLHDASAPVSECRTLFPACHTSRCARLRGTFDAPAGMIASRAALALLASSRGKLIRFPPRGQAAAAAAAAGAGAAPSATPSVRARGRGNLRRATHAQRVAG